jgi:hypothetical protein
LVALGDLSSLRANIGEKHAFSKHDVPNIEVEACSQRLNGVPFTVAIVARRVLSLKWITPLHEFLERVDGCGAEYYYIMENGQWYCGSMDERDPFYQRLVLLSQALETETVDQ